MALVTSGRSTFQNYIDQDTLCLICCVGRADTWVDPVTQRETRTPRTVCTLCAGEEKNWRRTKGELCTLYDRHRLRETLSETAVYEAVCVNFLRYYHTL